MRQLFAIILILSIVTSGFADIDEDRAKKAYADGRYADVVAELSVADLGKQKSSEMQYLLGRSAENEGRFEIAAASYAAVAKLGDGLAPNALMRLSHITHSTGNLLLERLYLEQLITLYPNSAAASGARLRIAKNNIETENYSDAIRWLKAASAKTSHPKATAVREVRSLLAASLLRVERSDDARIIFREIIDTVKEATQPDDFSLAAAKGLDLLDVGSENFGKKAPKITEAEHFTRANIYQYNREFAFARLHFEAIVNDHPSSANAANALFQIGRSYSQSSEFTEAMKWYERVLERYADDPIAKESLLQAASAYARVGKQKEAASRYQSYITKYPTDEKLDREYLNLVDIFRDLDNDTEALSWCRKAEETFRGKVPEVLAIFAAARIHFSREQWPAALADLDKLTSRTDLGGATVPGGTTVNEVKFLRGFAQEKLGQFPAAISSYLSVPDGRNDYYGSLATKRLIELSKDETADSHLKQRAGQAAEGLRSKDENTRRANAIILTRIANDPAIKKQAIELLANDGKVQSREISPRMPPPANGAAATFINLGLFDDAVIELKGISPAGVAQHQWASMLEKGGRADLSIAIVEPQWRSVSVDLPVEALPKEQLSLLYPAAFADELRRSAIERSVDPRLLLAIMRQESRFQTDARSGAAARGLMQFIPATANKISRELGRQEVSPDDLYDPATSVLFGSQYVSGLFKLFPSKPEAVAAGYNGGEDNMKRWLSRSRSELPDRYVAEIAFGQTKDYVQKVMANYRVYQYLYDEDLRQR